MNTLLSINTGETLGDHDGLCVPKIHMMDDGKCQKDSVSIMTDVIDLVCIGGTEKEARAQYAEYLGGLINLLQSNLMAIEMGAPAILLADTDEDDEDEDEYDDGCGEGYDDADGQ